MASPPPAAAAAVSGSKTKNKEGRKTKNKEGRKTKNKEGRKTKNKKQDGLSEVKVLGEQLLSSRSHINNLPRLLRLVKGSSPKEEALEAILSLHSFFTPLLPTLPPPPSSTPNQKPSESEAELIYLTWLRSNSDQFVASLLSIAISSTSDQTLRGVALDTLMEFIKLGNAGHFNSSLYHRLLRTIVHSSLQVSDLLFQLLVSNYFNYIDIRYFTYISLEKIARTLDSEDVADDKSASSEAETGNQSSASMELSIHKIYHILSSIQLLDVAKEASDYEMWTSADNTMSKGTGPFSGVTDKKNQNELSKSEHKKKNSGFHDSKDVSAASIAKRMKLKFTKAWISFLRLTLPIHVYKEVLVTLHNAVIPHLSNPVMLCDFLTQSYDIGGVVSVMALSSLYILMTKHGLEYPNFYEKLYALLEPSIFMAKYRAKFFQLLDSCLKSPLLPAYLAASFCKRLSRLALSVPPSGALVIIALVHNLLRRHASINFLVHQEDADEASKETSGTEGCNVGGKEDTLTGKKRGIDHFNAEESDPMKTNAMRSSLWEIDSLRHHFCPPVSRFVLSLETDLTVRAKTTEIAVKDFSSGSYATIFGEEMRRRVKQVPLAFYKSTPCTLFSDDIPGWSFTFNDEDPASVSDENVDSVACKRQRIETVL